jgi:murein DD-endopeptidase MepM/ murein hydrolase activator NlpD
MKLFLAGFLVVALAAIGILYVAAGRGGPPTITINKPDRAVGQSGVLEATVQAPAERLVALTIALEQNGRTTSLFTLGSPSAQVSPIDAGHVRVSRPFGKQSVPELQSGPARIVVTATRQSFLKLRSLSNSASKDVVVRLEPPRINVISTHHYVNHGGSEMVLYRVAPPDVASGVRVGDVEYPGFPALAAGAAGARSEDRVAFFALLYNQPLKAPIVAFARDEAGNEARATFIDNVFEKPFKRSRIELDDKFLGRIVPEILSQSPELGTPPPADGADLVAPFLKINGELRRKNSEAIAALSSKTSSKPLWTGPFVQLGNSQVEASFADHRTYMYKGKEVDQQDHLGFDLAVTSHVPVVAANNGTVVHASWLGIFGNCVIIDHGLGVQSLYGHLSSFDVKVGDAVTRGQSIGRSGMTGLAGGDHLHFTMLLNGRPVNPVEWWDAHWMQDRVERKLHEVGQSAASEERPAERRAPAERSRSPRTKRRNKV